MSSTCNFMAIEQRETVSVWLSSSLTLGSLLLCWKPAGGRGMKRGPSELPKAIRAERLHCSFNKRFTGVSICQTLVRLELIIIQLKLGPKELTIRRRNPACAVF